MREYGLALSNYLSFIVMLFFLTGAQSSLWLQLFGYFPAPLLWIPVLNYWIFHRRFLEAILFCYLITFILSAMTGMPLGLLFITQLSCFGLIYLLKDRVLWSTSLHFTISTAITAYALPLFVVLYSWMLESQRIADFHFFSWLLSPLFTALSAIFLYPIFNLIDRLTEKRAPHETEVEAL